MTDRRNLKLTLEYDGSGFAGWQIQPKLRTVQTELENAILKLTGEPTRIMGAGRTDAGVHALGQVASFHTNSPHPCGIFEAALNALLPDDIRVISAEEVNPVFDARRDATGRTYRYVLLRHPRVIGRQYAWYPRIDFDLDAMQKATLYLVGEHAFSAFCKIRSAVGSCISTVDSATWTEEDGMCCFDITGIRFFHNMIRILVGTLLEVGAGRMSADTFEQILNEGDRNRAGPTAPPRGLFLVRVDYNKRN